MKQTSKLLLQDLSERTHDIVNSVEGYKAAPSEVLQAKPNPHEWSVYECIEHLNRYGRFYLPEIEQRMTASNLEGSSEFRSGWLGNYFAKSMLPKPKLNRMKTFAAMNPAGSALSEEVLEEFLQQQIRLLQLLEQAQDKNLNRIRTSISISRWITLRLGDTFRVVVYHNQRHIAQATRVLEWAQHQGNAISAN